MLTSKFFGTIHKGRPQGGGGGGVGPNAGKTGHGGGGGGSQLCGRPQPNLI